MLPGAPAAAAQTRLQPHGRSRPGAAVAADVTRLLSHALLSSFSFPQGEVVSEIQCF